MRMLCMALVLCAGTASATALAAEPWLSRPIKLMVPFSAAGTADLLARLVASRLGPVPDQPVAVEHRLDADSTVGQEQVARASPDGYILVVSGLGSFIISPVFKAVPFHPFRGFTHIAYVGGQPVALFANKDLPFRSLSDLVSYAKAQPPLRSPTRPSRSDHKRNCSRSVPDPAENQNDACVLARRRS
jgi:tripartite-type tricarboxylate transporter receptor subunit TctC